LSRSVWDALAHQENIPHETAAALNRWQLIKLTGWTDDYVENLPLGKVLMYLQLEDGYQKGMNSLAKMGK